LEIQLNGWKSRDDIEINPEHKEFLRKAGASEILITYLDSNPENFEAQENRIGREVRRDIWFGDLRLDANPEKYDPEGSRMFTKLWEGDLYGAYREAGIMDVILFESTFDEDRINADREDQDQPKVVELDDSRFWMCENPLQKFEWDGKAEET
jgi:hypothetical protein